MKSVIAGAIAGLAMLASCRQNGDRPRAEAAPAAAPATPAAAPAEPAPPTASPPSPYTADIENLCDVVVRSGADQMAPGDRQIAIAEWLGGHLQTDEAHQFLVKIQPLEGAAKADALDAEARRVGLPGCALSAEWRPTPTPAK
jgi:hypothetical protein